MKPKPKRRLERATENWTRVDKAEELSHSHWKICTKCRARRFPLRNSTKTRFIVYNKNKCPIFVRLVRSKCIESKKAYGY